MSLSALPTALTVPPINLLAATALGIGLSCWAVRRGRQCWLRAGLWLAALGVVGLIVLGMPVVSILLLRPLEDNPLPRGAPPPQAIVILSAEAFAVLDEAAQPDVAIGPLTLERLRAGAALARREKLPILVSGGELDTDWPPVAALMARSLAEDFSVPARWQEGASLDTWENAQDSAAILRREGITSVWVVTHAWHMRRSLMAFRGAGLQAWPAPTARTAPPRLTLAGFIPQPAAWTRSYYAFHEWIGCLWYAFRARR